MRRRASAWQISLIVCVLTMSFGSVDAREQAATDKLKCAVDEVCTWILSPRAKEKVQWEATLGAPKPSDRFSWMEAWGLVASARGFEVQGVATATSGTGYHPRAWGNGTVTPECAVTPLCEIDLPISEDIAPLIGVGGGEVTGREVVVLAVMGNDSQITPPRGWKVTKLMGEEWFQIVRGADTSGAGVSVGHASAGVLQSVEARGGRFGSLALAALPCGLGGVGDAEVSGGTNAFPMLPPPSNDNKLTCDASSPDNAGAFTSRGGNQPWRVEGLAAGYSGADVRLSIIRLPRPVRDLAGR